MSSEPPHSQDEHDDLSELSDHRPRMGHGRPWTDAQLDDLRRRRESGAGWKEIAKHFKTTNATVRMRYRALRMKGHSLKASDGDRIEHSLNHSAQISQVDGSQRRSVGSVVTRNQELKGAISASEQEASTNTPKANSQLLTTRPQAASVYQVAVLDVHPTNTGGKLCCVCQKGHDIEANALLSCVDCSSLYHAQCHKPVVTPYIQLPWRCVQCWNRASIANKRSCPASDSNLNPPKNRRVETESTFLYETLLSKTPVALGVYNLETQKLDLERQVKDLKLQIHDEREATKKKDEALVALEHEIRLQKEAEPVVKLNEQLAAREAEYKESLEAKDFAVAQLERTVQAKDKTIQEGNTAMKKMATYGRSREVLKLKVRRYVHVNEVLKKQIEDLKKDSLTKAEETQHLHTKLTSFEEGFIMLQNAVSERDSTD